MKGTKLLKKLKIGVDEGFIELGRQIQLSELPRLQEVIMDSVYVLGYWPLKFLFHEEVKAIIEINLCSDEPVADTLGDILGFVSKNDFKSLTVHLDELAMVHNALDFFTGRNYKLLNADMRFVSYTVHKGKSYELIRIEESHLGKVTKVYYDRGQVK